LLTTAAIKAAHEHLERAAILYRTLGDRPHLGCSLTWLGWSLLMLGRMEEAEQAILETQNLLEHAGWPRTLANAYSAQLCIEMLRGHFQAARIAGEKAARLCWMAGADRAAFTVAANLVQLHLESGDTDSAIAAGRDMMVQLRDTPHSSHRGFVLGVLTAAHTARGDLNEALKAAREAAPLLRDEGSIFWLFDHLALCAALGGRARDAALIAGYADAVYEKFGRPREPMGRRAVERTTALLRETLGEPEFAALGRLGAQLSEDQALTLALGREPNASHAATP
jgi:tetratricopeptide (TPR) repeat protein